MAPQAKWSKRGAPYREAIAVLRSKIDLQSKHWDDYAGHIHGRAFAAAGATKLALLRDFHASLTETLSKGKTPTDFRKDFDAAVQRHGWTYKGKRGWRSEVIFRNNMRSARMAGRWQQIQRNKETRPYLRYRAILDNRTRDQHRAWDGAILPADNPWWNTHYPPNGWNCRCTVQARSPWPPRSSALRET